MDIQMKRIFYERPEPGARWQEVKQQEKVIDEQHYLNFVEATPFFKNLGGTEKKERAHTGHGYRVVKVTSTSPDKLMKRITFFDFD